MKTYTATDARKNLFTLTKDIIMSNNIARITSREGTCILLSEEEYESLLETATLLQIPHMKESLDLGDEQIKNGETYALDEVLPK